MAADPYRCPNTDERLTVRWSSRGRTLLERIYRNRRALRMRCTRGDIIEEALIYTHDSGISDECYNRLNEVRELLISRGENITRAQLQERFVWEGSDRVLSSLQMEEKKSG